MKIKEQVILQEKHWKLTIIKFVYFMVVPSSPTQTSSSSSVHFLLSFILLFTKHSFVRTRLIMIVHALIIIISRNTLHCILDINRTRRIFYCNKIIITIPWAFPNRAAINLYTTHNSTTFANIYMLAFESNSTIITILF